MLPYPMIESNANPIVKQLRSLHAKKARREHSLFLAEGPKILAEAFGNGETFETIFVLETADDNVLALAARIIEAQPNAKCYSVNQKVLEAVSDTRSPQGIVASLALPTQSAFPPVDGFGLILDSIQDPGNVGAMIRSADALGAQWILLLGACADPYSPKTLRAAMGSTFHLPIFSLDDTESALLSLHEHDYFLLAADLQGEDKLPEKLPAKTALMIGNEGHGLSKDSLDNADLRYRLAMRGRSESLNASTCTALMLYISVERLAT